MSEDYLTVSHLSTKDLARLFGYLSISETSFYNGEPCWEWAVLGETGYGRLFWRKRMHSAHRFFYAWLVSPIPKGQKHGELDHLCRNRGCVNPAHLEHVPSRVNTLRSNSVSGKNARKMRCQSGHEFRYRQNGSRWCYTCWLDKRKHRFATDAVKAEQEKARQREVKRRKYLKDSALLKARRQEYHKRLMADPVKAGQKRAKERAWRAEDRERHRAYARAWYAQNKAKKQADNS